VLKTADSVSPIAAPAVAASLVGFFIVYATVFGFGLFYILRLCGKLPQVAGDTVDFAAGRVAHGA
jgi:cytochrome bd ubiquinol oxidase subunit I